MKPAPAKIDKIANPSKYYPGWGTRSAEPNARTINYWVKKDLPGLWKDFINKVSSK